MPTDEQWMRRALELASLCAEHGDVPIGAVVVRDDEEIGAAGNERELRGDPTAHAEILAVRHAAAAAESWRLDGCTLYVTLEPCAMCAGAIVLARLDRVVFGAWDERAGMGGSVADLLRHPKLNHRPEVLAGVHALDSAELLTRFFRARRQVVDSPSSTV